MEPTKSQWKLTRAQVIEATWFVLGAMFVGFVGLRYPALDVAVVGIALWVLVIGGFVALNVIRSRRR
jgi:hypothetical protein